MRTGKWMAAVFAAAMLLTVAVQGGEKYRFAYLVQDLGNQFWVAVSEGVKDKCAELGIDVIVLDARTDPAKQLANAEDAIQKKVDYILLSPWDPPSGATAVEAANKAKIPVAVLDVGVSGGKIDTFIVSDNFEGGEIAGNYGAKLLADKPGATAAHIQCQLGYIITQLRGDGFTKIMNDKGYKIVAKQPADSQRSLGMTVMQNILQANPNLSLVFSENDEMALGALEAVRAANKMNQVKIIGFDGTSDAVDSIKAGELAGTVAQQPYKIGQMGVEAAVKALKGEKLPETTYVPTKLITKETL